MIIIFAELVAVPGDCTDKNSFKYTTNDKMKTGNPVEKKFKIEFSDVDGKLWVTDSDKGPIGTFETDKTKKTEKVENKYLREVITDGSVLVMVRMATPYVLISTENQDITFS